MAGYRESGRGQQRDDCGGCVTMRESVECQILRCLGAYVIGCNASICLVPVFFRIALMTWRAVG